MFTQKEIPVQAAASDSPSTSADAVRVPSDDVVSTCSSLSFSLTSWDAALPRAYGKLQLAALQGLPQSVSAGCLSAPDLTLQSS